MKELAKSLLTAILVFLAGVLIFIALFFPGIVSIILFETNVIAHTKITGIIAAVITTIWLMTGIIFITSRENNDYYARDKEN